MSDVPIASSEVSVGTYPHYAEDGDNDSLTDKLLTHLNMGQYKEGSFQGSTLWCAPVRPSLCCG